jgi:hypothetical protein
MSLAVKMDIPFAPIREKGKLLGKQLKLHIL